MAKQRYRAIPVPRTTLQSLQATCEALKENVELLTRQSGSEAEWPVTASELRRLGILDGTRPLPDAPERKR